MDELQVHLHVFGHAEDHLVVASETVAVEAWGSDGTRRLFVVIDKQLATKVGVFTFAEGVLAAFSYRLQGRWNEGHYGVAQFVGTFVKGQDA